MKKCLIAAFLIIIFALPATAAQRFWVGGTGPWDASNTADWSTTSGGSSGASIPGVSDDVIFDSSSGGGIVTVNNTISVNTISFGTFTGTLDFSVNNNNVTVAGSTGITGSGISTRTLKMGNGTWTITTLAIFATPWNFGIITNLTLIPNGSTIKFSGNTVNARTFSGGIGLTYNNLLIDTNTSMGGITMAGANTFNNIAMNGPSKMTIVGPASITATSLTLTATQGNEIYIGSSIYGVPAGIIVASGTQTLTRVGLRAIAFSGGASFVANTSMDLGLNSGIIFTGGSPCILGGWLLWRDLKPINDNFPAWLNKAS